MDSKEKRGARASWGRLLLVIPFIAVLWVPFYSAIEPKVFGVPFFYWYQLVWILISSAITVFVYRLEH